MNAVTAPIAETDLSSPADGPAFDRDTLFNGQGVRYRDFKRTLTPRYGIVWRDLLAGHLALVLIAAGVIACECYLSTGWAVAAAVVGCVLFGYTFAYINLFFHEASHYLLAADRARNDRLANLFVGVLFGQDIKAYRVIHFDHHRHLGTPQDTERSYFDALNLRFFLELLTGVKALKVILNRDRTLKERPRQPSRPAPVKSLLTNPLFLGLALHIAVVGTAAALGLWLFAGAWVLGMGLVYPFFGAVRQVLEHRSEHARSDVDYRREPHGAESRLFGDGPIASTLGGAGFNRHLLHHWEPQVSYTRLRELERFLLDTELGDHLRSRRTTYWRTFFRLLSY
jgi:fatty acid desaturase